LECTKFCLIDTEILKRENNFEFYEIKRPLNTAVTWKLPYLLKGRDGPQQTTAIFEIEAQYAVLLLTVGHKDYPFPHPPQFRLKNRCSLIRLRGRNRLHK
jgi:hypothetical protein